MTRICTTRGCRNEAIPSGRDCPEHLPRFFPSTLPEWRRRALEDQRNRGIVAAKVLA